MLTVEKDKDAEQIFIHGSPEELRQLAAKLVAIAGQAERSGQSHDHFMSAEWGGGELGSNLRGSKESSAIINHVVVYGWSSKSADS